MKKTLLLPLLLLAACVGEPAPLPAQAPGANAPMHAARATLNGTVLEARLIDAATLAAPMARRYGIAQTEGTWLLLVTVRDAQGNGIPADAMTLHARAGGLTDALTPLPLRRIAVDGFTDFVGSVQAKPPATLRIEIDAVHQGARAEMRFSRDLPKP